MTRPRRVDGAPHQARARARAYLASLEAAGEAPAEADGAGGARHSPEVSPQRESLSTPGQPATGPLPLLQRLDRFDAKPDEPLYEFPPRCALAGGWGGGAGSRPWTRLWLCVGSSRCLASRSSSTLPATRSRTPTSARGCSSKRGRRGAAGSRAEPTRAEPAYLGAPREYGQTPIRRRRRALLWRAGWRRRERAARWPQRWGSGEGGGGGSSKSSESLDYATCAPLAYKKYWPLVSCRRPSW